jgi:cytochrome c553
MDAMADPLTDQDIKDLAAYFSGLPSKLSDLHGKIEGGN